MDAEESKVTDCVEEIPKPLNGAFASADLLEIPNKLPCAPKAIPLDGFDEPNLLWVPLIEVVDETWDWVVG